MEQEKSTEYPKTKFRALTWALLGVALVGTYVLSHRLESGSGNAAAVYLSTGSTREITLFTDRVEPRALSARVGDEIVFSIGDQSIHNIAEERQSRSAPRLESGEIGPGDSYVVSFSVPGVVSFYDRMNLDLRVTVTVTE